MTPRSEVLKLAKQGMKPAAIAAATHLTRGQVSGLIRRLRETGDLPGAVKPAAPRPPQVRKVAERKRILHDWSDSALTERWEERKLRRAREKREALAEAAGASA